jgi:hypothetical protein
VRRDTDKSADSRKSAPRERKNGKDRKAKSRDTKNAEEELHEKETENRHAPPCTSLRFPSWTGACE